MAHELTEYAGTMLAGLGADVWLVEPPGGADPSAAVRRRGTPSRRSIAFVARNAGKRSVVIDPASPTTAGPSIGSSTRPTSWSSTSRPLCGHRGERARVRITDSRHIGVSPVVVFAASGSLSSSGWPHQPPCNAPSWLALDAVSTFAAVAAVLLVREHRDRPPAW